MAPGITMMDNKGQGLKKCAANLPSTPTGFLLSHCVYIASDLLQWLDMNYFMYPLEHHNGLYNYYCENTLFV